MIEKRLQYALEHFIEDGYFLKEASSYLLRETEKGGEGELKLEVFAEANLCIENFDKKKRCEFVRKSKKDGMGTCADHILFKRNNNEWELVIIEMKSQIDEKRLTEIRGKTRSSYLNALAIAAFLGITISNVSVITTYEKDDPISSAKNTTNPILFKMPLGKAPKNDPIYDWFHNLISIDIGEVTRKEFPHIKLKMERHPETHILVGTLTI